MGDIANDLVNGAACAHCGTYFEREHGFPVLCHHCWKRASAADRKAHARATHKEL